MIIPKDIIIYKKCDKKHTCGTGFSTKRCGGIGVYHKPTGLSIHAKCSRVRGEIQGRAYAMAHLEAALTENTK